MKGLCFLGSLVLFLFCPWIGTPSEAGDVDALLKEANAHFRSADKDFMSGKLESALATAEKAREVIMRARAVAPSDHRVSSLEKKIDQLAEKIAKRVASTGALSPAPDSAGGGARLPATAARYLREATAALDRFDRIVGPDRSMYNEETLPQKLREYLDVAEAGLASLQDEFSDQKNHPDVVAALERRDEARSILEEMESARAGGERVLEEVLASAEDDNVLWLKRLRPYVASPSRMDDGPYRVKGKELSGQVSYSTTPEELVALWDLHEEAWREWKAYEKEGPGEPEELLVETAREIEKRRQSFQASLRSLGEDLLDEVRSDLDYGLEFVAENRDRAGKGELFNLLGREVLLAMAKKVDGAAAFLSEEDDLLVRARADLASIEEDVANLRDRAAERTRMNADRFQGPERDEVLSAVETTVKTHYSGGALLRTTIISPQWEQEWRFVEDSNDGIVRLRFDRYLTAQAAVKDGDDVFLLTLSLYATKKPDGSWRPMEGRILYRDRMVEENVDG